VTIAFSHIPANLRVPGTYFDIDGSGANSGQQQLRTLIIGQALAGTPYAALGVVGVPAISLGAADARANAGYGSMLALMVGQSRARDSFGEVWVLPLADDPAAVAATGSTALSGVASVAGTLPLYVNFVAVPVLVPAGMAAAQLATATAAAVNALPDLPVTAAVSAGTVTYTAKNKGLAGNDLDIRMAYRGPLGGEVVPAGIAVTMTAMAGGTTNPSLAVPLLSLADMGFEVVVSAYSDSASLDALRSFMDDNTGRWSWQHKRYGHVYAARSANLSAATTFGASHNDQHLTVLPMDGCPLSPPQIAADYAAAVMESVRADPALPLQYLSTNIPAPSPQRRFAPVDRNTLLYDGLSTYKVVGGAVVIERLVTTNQLNAAGAVDTSYLNCETMHCLGYVCRDLDSFLSTIFARSKLTADNVKIPAGSALVNPAVIKATVDTRYRYLCEVLGVCQDPDGFALSSRAELAGGGRVNVYAPIRLMGQLRIMAISVAFSKPS